MRVLYLLGCNEGPSKRYRVFNHIECLKLHGVDAEWAWDIDAKITDPAYVGGFSIVVDFRSGVNDRVERFFALVRELDIPLVFDIDDLVFDPEAVKDIDVYRRMEPAAQKEYLDGIRSIASALRQCDYVTTSTSFLKRRIEALFDKPTWIVPFGVNGRQVEIADGLDAWEGPEQYIGYLSGTNTHQKDFEEAAGALRRVLSERDNVYLKLIGYLDPEAYLPGLSHKIMRLDFMDWQDLLIETGSLTLALAPFEPDSLFCKAKSELKFVETGLCRVPTVASAVPSFVEAIQSGVNGYIVRTEDEWYEAICALLDDKAHHDRVAAAALETCRKTYYPERIGRTLIKTYSAIIKQHMSREPLRARPTPTTTEGLRISWVIPQPFEGSGGHRNIFRAVRYLSDFGHSCSVYVLPDNLRFSSGLEIDQFIAREFFDMRAEEVILGVDDITDCDVLICTYWTTAYVIQKHRDKAKAHIYFLQDFEPMFFPMGTDYVRAMETYKFGFHFVTSGPWPLRMLEAELGLKGGGFFRFPIDRAIYHPPARRERRARKRVLFFARPDMPRRCYPLGVAALEIVKRERPDVEIVFYGDRSEKFGPPFEFTNIGMTDTIQELGDLYRTGDVGLCFSTTNPSLVPFEMMACGCPVVDLDVNGNEVNYGGRDNCTLAAPEPRAIADAVLKVLDDEPLAEGLRTRGAAFTEQFPTEIEMAKIIETEILGEFERKTAAAKTPAKTAASRTRPITPPGVSAQLS